MCYTEFSHTLLQSHMIARMMAMKNEIMLSARHYLILPFQVQSYCVTKRVLQLKKIWGRLIIILSLSLNSLTTSYYQNCACQFCPSHSVISIGVFMFLPLFLTFDLPDCSVWQRKRIYSAPPQGFSLLVVFAYIWGRICQLAFCIKFIVVTLPLRAIVYVEVCNIL